MYDEIKNEQECTTGKGYGVPQSPLSDEHIVELVRKGDHELYGELMERYQKKLFRYARVLLRDDDDAADAVQEALVAAFRNLHGFDAKRRFSSWIYRIVHNAARNMVVKRKFMLFLSPSEWIIKEETLPDGEESIESKLWSEELGIVTRRHVDALPRPYKDPVVLFYVEEKTYEEIAEILKVPINTVGTRLSRAKKMLREKLARDGNLYEKRI